ncbi:MAG TPA: hypothetical protein VFB60_09095 [Ktedonobacteraceae bacterium]|nr:hypothetical protein [Ktedonobacteraceae bacterium]
MAIFHAGGIVAWNGAEADALKLVATDELLPRAADAIYRPLWRGEGDKPRRTR